MIAIIDYGAGNLFSVKNALDFLGYENIITSSAEDLKRADKLILPGVGALPDAMKKLNETGLVEVILDEIAAKDNCSGKPLLGICLGMQMLFQKGYEFEETDCLGILEGEVRFIDAPGLKIPHMGWSDIKIENKCPLSVGIKEGDMLYYVHSYKAVTPKENISLYSEYGGIVPGLVFNGNVYGAQFHPEKSGKVGLGILKNFANL
ncbi:imidazole glycerol phosphate synthase subunit HisH [Anaerovorax odorimutans]|uniref:imidazole glycerol phosphate synthase subunit HisH n=1 Tax=Anaerovorax odorimutans TaxID=109327 RepID=UPI000411C9D5|nr:imidazole glycerol phosphate synthase subunit HisH [Anaerovorax odorimutans]